jgi:hypothetical protein
LKPGSCVEAHLEHDRLANKRVERFRHVAHTSRSSVSVRVGRFRAEEAIVTSSRFNSTGAVYLPPSVAVCAMVQKYVAR